MLRSGLDSTDRIKKGDIILIAAVILLSLIGLLFLKSFGKKGSAVEVTINNSVYGVYSLNENQEIDIKDENGIVTNILTIEDECASMTVADCPDQICVNHSPISKKGETIVCLPHKVVVEITTENPEKDDVDVIAE